ncbi:MAG: asparagine synthase (glutamine-hydrolyzing) [Bacteroidetes bacterium]|nr:asparagine synthase (glutamine-hydrolyzing) [Bacteroidota bacterium]
MCGIAFGPASPGNEEVLACLAHRGPDGEGQHQSGAMWMGHRRLAIIDPDPRSAQPMISLSGKSVLVFNGEIYNYKTLRQYLAGRGIRFRTTSDTEVVLEGIELDGPEFISRLDGIFAIIWLNRETGSLVISRDQAGKNPLYGCIRDGLVLASEIKGIMKLKPGHKFNLSAEGLGNYLRYGFIPEPMTLWEDIFMFPSGYTAVLRIPDSGKLNPGSYGFPSEWILTPLPLDPSPAAPPVAGTEKKQVQSLVLSAIEKRLVADVPVGTFLSGGIDSSLLVGAMVKEFGLKPVTASVLFDDPEHSEEDRIRLILAKWKTDHTDVRLKTEEIKTWIPEALSAYDHPSIDGVNTFIVSKAVRKSGLKVAVSGLGGDELFQGYNTFSQARNLNRIPGFLSPFLRAAGQLSGKESWIRASEATGMKSPFQPVSSIRALYSELSLKKLSGTDFTGWNPAVSPFDEFHFQNLKGDSLLIAQEWFGYMKNMLIRDTNIMSMANSLEVRAPFTDRSLLAWMLQVPDRIKRPVSVKKQFLTDSCSDWLLPEIVKSRKMGFLLPMGQWLTGPHLSLVEQKLVALSRFPQTAGLEQTGLNLIQETRQNPARWPWLWQLVVLGQVLEGTE